MQTWSHTESLVISITRALFSVVENFEDMISHVGNCSSIWLSHNLLKISPFPGTFKSFCRWREEWPHRSLATAGFHSASEWVCIHKSLMTWTHVCLLVERARHDSQIRAGLFVGLIRLLGCPTGVRHALKRSPTARVASMPAKSRGAAHLQCGQLG